MLDFLINGMGTFASTICNTFLYKRGSSSGAGIDPLAPGGVSNSNTPTPTPLAPGTTTGVGVQTAPLPNYFDSYVAQITEKAKESVKNTTLVFYVFSLAFPSMNILWFMFTILFIISFEFIVWGLKIMKIVGEVWQMLGK
jgi:hypothetical protein